MVARIRRACIALSSDSVFLSFLYHTRTLTSPRANLQALPLRPARPCPFRSYSSAQSNPAPGNNRESSSSQAASSGEASGARGYLKQRTLKSNAAPKNSPQSTLTDAEREIFTRISSKFDIAPPVSGIGEEPISTEAKQRQSHPPSEFDDEQSENVSRMYKTVIKDSIHEQATYRQRSKRRRRRDKLTQTSQSDSNATVPRTHTTSQRDWNRVYSKVRSFQDTDPNVSSPESKEMDGISPFALARVIAMREVEKIKKELDAAFEEGKSDIGIWDVCEKRVFGMLRLLDGQEESVLASMKENNTDESETNSKLHRRNQRRKKRGEHKAINEQNAAVGSSFSTELTAPDCPLEIPAGVPILPIVSTAYPRTLLHALRLLHTHFPMSEITSQMHESIRSQGRASFVLGSSVHLYNELISHRWTCFSDIPRVVALLEEMEEIGVEFNEETLQLIDQIREQRSEELEKLGTQKDSNQSWWWDTDASRQAYEELTGGDDKKAGWVERVRTLVEKEAERKRDLMKRMKQLEQSS